MEKLAVIFLMIMGVLTTNPSLKIRYITL